MAGETTALPRHFPVVQVRAAAPLTGGMTMMEMEQGVQASGDVVQEVVAGEGLRSPVSSKKERLKVIPPSSPSLPQEGAAI